MFTGGLDQVSYGHCVSKEQAIIKGREIGQKSAAGSLQSPTPAREPLTIPGMKELRGKNSLAGRHLANKHASLPSTL